MLLVVQGDKANLKQSMQVNGAGGLEQTTGLMRRNSDVRRHSFALHSRKDCGPVCPTGCDSGADATKKMCAKCAKCMQSLREDEQQGNSASAEEGSSGSSG